MLPYQVLEAGSFTSDATQMKQIKLSAQPDLFVLKNRSGWGNDAAVTAVESEWKKGMSQDAFLSKDQAITSGILSSNVGTANGFIFIDTANPPVYAALASTAITGSAATYVVSMADTGSINVGDWVRLYASTGELQLAGYGFQVTAVSANVSITLGYMASGGQVLAADATAAQVKKYIPNMMYPRYGLIANISQAVQAVVYFTGKNDYTPGQILSFRVPSEFGMKEINNVHARVLSVTNSATVSSVTLDIDSSGFTAFAFPTSAVAAAGVSPAVAVPSASGVIPESGSASVPQVPESTNLLDAFDSRNKYVMQLGSNVITEVSDVYDWYSIVFDRHQAE